MVALLPSKRKALGSSLSWFVGGGEKLNSCINLISRAGEEWSEGNLSLLQATRQLSLQKDCESFSLHQCYLCGLLDGKFP